MRPIPSLLLAVALGCGTDAAAPAPAPEETPSPAPDVTPPTVSTYATDRGYPVSAVSISCYARDDVGVSLIEIYAQDGSLLDACPSPGDDPWWICGWRWSQIPAPDGPYTFTCRAYDRAGNVATDTGRFTVFHAAPGPPALVGMWDFVVTLSEPLPTGVDPTCSGALEFTLYGSSFYGCLVGSAGGMVWGNIQRIDLDDAGNVTMALKENPLFGHRQFTIIGTLTTPSTISGAVTGGPFSGEPFTATRRP